MIRYLLSLVLFSFALGSVSAQEQETYWVKADSLYKFVQPSASMQFWSIYSMKEQLQLNPDLPMQPVEDRVNFIVRRARFGLQGSPYTRLKYKLTIQYDNIGKDRFGATKGGTSTGQLGILDAYLTWKISNNELLNLTFGYFHPQISRESITGDMLVNSFDKAVSQGYIRQHVNGKGYGRSTGINIGGLKKYDIFTIGYNLGLFNNNTTAEDSKSTPETSGVFWSPLFSNRLTLSVGNPDKSTYSLNYGANNTFNKRKGITIGLNNTSQGKTDIFSSNYASGVDFLFNFQNLNFDGEWFWLERHQEGRTVKAQAGHVRIGYNIILFKKYFLEPTAMASKFVGDSEYRFTGEDYSLDFGLNWYLNKQKLKLAIHYVKQGGNGDNNFTDESTFRKGDFVGIAFVVLL